MVCGLYLNKDIKNIRDRSAVLNSGCLLQSLEEAKNIQILREGPTCNQLNQGICEVGHGPGHL